MRLLTKACKHFAPIHTTQMTMHLSMAMMTTATMKLAAVVTTKGSQPRQPRVADDVGDASYRGDSDGDWE